MRHLSLARLSQDSRLGIRALKDRPAFAATAVLTLALGIGLSAAVFTVANALLLRRLPVRDQDRVVVLWGKKPEQEFNYPLGLDAARDFAQQSRTLERVGSFGYEGAVAVLIRDGDQISRFRRTIVSGDFFGALDVRPHLGRTLRPSDDVWGAERAIVLSYPAWQQRFGGDTSIIGRRLLMHEDGATYTVVGVMPLGIDYPRGTDIWAAVQAAIPPQSLQYAAVNLIGRLTPGATPDNARDELTTFFSRADASSWLRDQHGVTSTLATMILGDTRPALFAFAAASALLLLIACLNVANLLLVRGLERTREMAVRTALGAGRGDLVRQLLTENTLLAIAGGLFGALVAAGGVKIFVAFAPETIPRLNEVRVSAATVGGALGIAIVALLMFALAPALTSSRADVHTALRSDARQTPGPRSRFATETLVAVQVALSLVVLSAAGLIAKSLVKLERADLSFDASRLLIAELALRYDKLDDVAKQRAAVDEVSQRVQRIPQAQSVSPVVAVPFSGTGGGWDGRPAKEGQSVEEASANPVLNMEVVAPKYFETFAIPILRGRGFTAADREGSVPVVLISQSAARHYWPGADPIGKRLRMGPQLDKIITVVGVVPDTRYRELREARPSIYFALGQSTFPFTPTTLAIRTRGEPKNVIAALRRAVADSTPGVALASAAPFETFLDKPLAQPRLNALLLGVFASACVVLAAIGLFGVMATMVRQRVREFGVRMALGATPRDVLRMVMGRGLAIAGAGLLVGLAVAVVVNQLLTTLLYEVTPTDGATLFGVSVLLLAVAGLASLLPARSGTRINLVNALRIDG